MKISMLCLFNFIPLDFPYSMYEKEKFLISLLGSAEEEELGIARVLFRYKILLLIT